MERDFDGKFIKIRKNDLFINLYILFNLYVYIYIS